MDAEMQFTPTASKDAYSLASAFSEPALIENPNISVYHFVNSCFFTERIC